MKAHELWMAWKRAIHEKQPMTARAQADTLLDVLVSLSSRPRWKGAERTEFFHWCEREGLLKK